MLWVAMAVAVLCPPGPGDSEQRGWADQGGESVGRVGA